MRSYLARISSLDVSKPPQARKDAHSALFEYLIKAPKPKVLRREVNLKFVLDLIREEKKRELKDYLQSKNPEKLEAIRKHISKHVNILERKLNEMQRRENSIEKKLQISHGTDTIRHLKSTLISSFTRPITAENFGLSNDILREMTPTALLKLKPVRRIVR